MATAAMKGRANAGVNGGSAIARQSMPMEVLVVEDNGGNYHWTLVDRDGNSLAWSPHFASYQDAEDAARRVLAGAGAAQLERRAAPDSSLDTPSKARVPTTAKKGDRAGRRIKEATGVHVATTA